MEWKEARRMKRKINGETSKEEGDGRKPTLAIDNRGDNFFFCKSLFWKDCHTIKGSSKITLH